MQLDGNRVVLVDLSSTGAQVISPVPLRLGQHVRIVMADHQARLRFAASVVWASFELSGGHGITGYRVGLHFIDADRKQVAAFGARNRRIADAVRPAVSSWPATSAKPTGPRTTLPEPEEKEARPGVAAGPSPEEAAPATAGQPAPETARPAPPKRKACKKKSARREKTPRTAAKQERAGSADRLRDLPAGTRVVVKVGSKQQTITLVRVKRTRFLAATADGEELDLPVEQFVRAEK